MVYWLLIFFGIMILSVSLSNPIYNLVIKKHYNFSFSLQIILRITIFFIAIIIIFTGLYIESIS